MGAVRAGAHAAPGDGPGVAAAAQVFGSKGVAGAGVDNPPDAGVLAVVDQGGPGVFRGCGPRAEVDLPWRGADCGQHPRGAVRGPGAGVQGDHGVGGEGAGGPAAEADQLAAAGAQAAGEVGGPELGIGSEQGEHAVDPGRCVGQGVGHGDDPDPAPGAGGQGRRPLAGAVTGRGADEQAWGSGSEAEVLLPGEQPGRRVRTGRRAVERVSEGGRGPACRGVAVTAPILAARTSRGPTPGQSRRLTRYKCSRRVKIHQLG